MNSVETRLDRIELMLSQLIKSIDGKNKSAYDNWLTEPEVMEILNLTKRAMRDIRKKNQIRTSSATGRNFKYYRADVDNYLYENSAITKRRSAK